MSRAGRVAALLALLAGCALLLPDVREMLRWRETTAELRGLEFDGRRGPTLRRVDGDEVLRVLTGELLRSYPEDYVAAYEAAYKALGLLPRDLDLVRVLLELQAEQIAGLYTPSDDVMYVRNDLPPGAEEVEPIVVHELVHALQARHFQLAMGLIRGLRHNDDVAVGIAAATEGDASLTMLGVPSAESTLRRDLKSAVRLQLTLRIDLDHPTGVFARAPRMLQRSLLFPYAEGVVLAALRYERAGNAGLDALMRNPPLSSLRVFEPADTRPVEFVRVPGAEIARALEPGCFAGHHNVVGALGVLVLLEEHAGGADPEAIREAIRGWAGDRFVHVGCPEREDFAWYTRWASEDAARDFAALYARAAPSIAGSAGFAAPPRAERRGRDVLVLTAGLLPLSQSIREAVEVRAYGSLTDWVAGGCFPESPCPHDLPGWLGRAAGGQ